jgi:phosphatidylglycerol:prolipoprotein diacylglycerol transferase
MLKVFDMVAPGVMLGQIIGRWGNFVNGEAHGVETSESFFLRMGLMGAADTDYPFRMVYFHPTFLYESLWNLIGFVLINLFYKKKKFDGQIVLMYLAWYGFGRMLIEGLRTDSLYIGVFRISQVVGFLCFAICTALLVYFYIRSRRGELDTEEYVPVYEKLRGIGLRRRVKENVEKQDGNAEIADEVLSETETKKDTATDEEKE